MQWSRQRHMVIQMGHAAYQSIRNGVANTEVLAEFLNLGPGAVGKKQLRNCKKRNIFVWLL